MISQHLILPSILFAALSLLAGCSSKPYSAEPLPTDEQARVETALAAFKGNPNLSNYFEKAAGYAVYPSVFRAGTGFGIAYGRGWIYRDGKLSGKTQQAQLFIGANLGAQFYRQIIFFKNEQALTNFNKSSVEFAGQAHAAFVVWGGGSTPSFNSEVAIFTQLRGGLMLEASVGAHGFLQNTQQQDSRY